MPKSLRVPAALIVAVLGCGGDKPKADAGDGSCAVICFPDGSDAGVCPDPFVCVSEQRTCPSGCTCSTYCFPRTAQGELNCPPDDLNGLDCAAPDRTCPEGCDPVS